MSPETHSQLANFIWSICNLLRGPYKRNKYRGVNRGKVYKDREVFLSELHQVAGKRDMHLSVVEIKAVLNALGERDETTEICRDKKGKSESDPELRDTESVPLKENIAENTSSARSSPMSPTPGSTRAKPGSATRSRSTGTSTSTNRPARWRSSKSISRCWNGRLWIFCGM